LAPAASAIQFRLKRALFAAVIGREVAVKNGKIRKN
jgi:hypothetical protein